MRCAARPTIFRPCEPAPVMKCAGVFFAALMVFSAPAAAQIVRVDGGLVQGSTTGQVTAYKGIAFAAPPTGALRWRPPQPAAKWQGVRKADAFAPACMQTGVSMPGEAPPTISEDCLYLNIWKPAAKTREKLAVLVKIYGGGFSSGSAAMPLYWGDKLAARGIIVVTFGYRLGPFGFLAHPELTEESPDHTSGNYGLLDQIAALAWVKRNIGAFGGDASRVTIAGQSAGGNAVSILMASPLGKGLFQRAIAESGGLFEPLKLAPNYLLAKAEKEGLAYATSVGAQSLAALRALPAPSLLQGKAGTISHPVIEPHLLPASPYDVFAAGRQNDVPILLGSNANEAGSFVTNLDAVKAATFEADIAKQFGQLPPPLLAAYPHNTDPQAREARLGFERDLRFGWDMWAWARLGAMKGHQNVYYYHFTKSPPFPKGSIYQDWGTSHFAELWYVFDHLDQQPWDWSAADRSLADAMSGYWVNFAKTGDPNGPGLPTWPAFKETDGNVQYLGDPITTGGVANLRPLQVFDRVYDGVRGAPFGTPSAP
jgi:para-nitrobenzyl esterase